MKNFRTILMILALVMLTIACSKKENKEATKEETYKIVWYGIGGRPADTDKVFAEISKYTKEKINAEIEYRAVDWGDFQQKMQVMTAAGDSFDLAFTASWTGYSRLAAKGAFLPLDELIQEAGQDVLKELDPKLLNGAKVNGVLYAIPNKKEMAGLPVYRVNETLLQKYNLSLDGVKSLDDLMPLMKIIKDKEPDVVPFAVFGNTNYGTENLDFLVEPKIPGAVKVTDKGLTVINQFADADMVAALKQYRKLYEAGYILKEAPSIPDKSDLQKTGKWFVGRADYQPFAENIWKEGLGYGVKVVPAYEKPLMTTNSITGSMLAISATSKNPKKVMEFINLLNTDEKLRNMIDSGIEGVHFKKIGEHRMENLPDSKNYDMPSFSLGNVFKTYLYPNDPDNKWEEFEKFNNSATVSPLLGFTFNPEPVKSEIAAINNIAEEYGPSLFLGAVDIDKQIKVMTDKMNKVGLEKVLQEMQKQINEWKKTL